MKQALLYLAVMARWARSDKLSRTYVYTPDGW